MAGKQYKQQDYLINQYPSFIEARNDKLHVDERRYTKLLKTTAGGTLAMGIWSVIRSFMNAFEGTDEFFNVEGVQLVANIIGTMIIALLFFIAGISLRYIIWRGALKEATDGKRRYGYIVCAIVLMLYGVYAIVAFFYDLIKKNEVDEENITILVHGGLKADG